jgi:diamine oxidase
LCSQEWYSSSHYDQQDPFLDPFSFDDLFKDDESLQDADIVAWASIGMQHIPHSEDIPNTATSGNGAKLVIRPHNFFDEDASTDLVNSVYITKDDKGAVRMRNFADEHGGGGHRCSQPRSKSFDGNVIKV